MLEDCAVASDHDRPTLLREAVGLAGALRAIVVGLYLAGPRLSALPARGASRGFCLSA